MPISPASKRASLTAAVIAVGALMAACSGDARVDRFYGTYAGANFELPEAAALDALPDDAGAVGNGGTSTDAPNTNGPASGASSGN